MSIKLNNYKLIKSKRYNLALLLVLACTFMISASAKGESAISQAYLTTSTNITTGSLISVTNSGGKLANAANTKNVSNLVGISGSKPLVELSSGNDNNLQVIVGGAANALVSNMNGDVKIGDKITASPLDGIGMKATTSVEVVGTAQANLKSVQTIDQKITKSNGKSSTVKVGMVPVDVNISYYTAPIDKSQANQFLPPFLQSLANSISGKQVSPWRVLIGTVALILGFAASMVMLYASVRSNMISLGRNPLAKGALRKGFFDVAIFAIGVLVITMAATFVILSI